MKLNIDQIRKKVLPILKEEGVVRAALFGSYARGEGKANSDIDILVELPRGKSLLDLVGLEMKLKETLRKKVDLITYNSVSPYLKEYILKDQIQIV